MKTVLTFVTGLLFTLTTMAADHNPTVTIKSRRNFEIVIDGRTYRDDGFYNNTIRLDMRRGMHEIRVFERGRGFFGRPRLVSAKNFFVRNNDLRITVGYDGYVDVDQRGYNGGDRGWDRNDRGWDDNDRGWNGNDRGYDRNDRDYSRNHF
jgi:hypothetical protein